MAALLLAIGGCGSNGKPLATPVPTQPATTPNPTSTATKAPEGKVDALTALAIENGAVALANYCVHKLGARIGKQQPPSAKMKQLKDNAVFSLIYEAKRHPDARIAGKSILERLNDAESLLTQGNCDPRSARKLRDASG